MSQGPSTLQARRREARLPALPLETDRVNRARNVPIAHVDGPQYVAFGSRVGKPYFLRVEGGREARETSAVCSCPDSGFRPDLVCKHLIAVLGARGDPRVVEAAGGRWQGSPAPAGGSAWQAPAATPQEALARWDGKDEDVGAWMVTHAASDPAVFRAVADRAPSDGLRGMILGIGPGMADAGVRRALTLSVADDGLMRRLARWLAPAEFRDYCRTAIARGWYELVGEMLSDGDPRRLGRLEIPDLEPLFKVADPQVREAARKAMGDIAIAQAAQAARATGGTRGR